LKEAIIDNLKIDLENLANQLTQVV